jgi:transposase
MKRQLANQVNSRHARIILLSRGGVRNREIAARTDCTPQWVRVVVHRFNNNGIEGIAWYPYFQTRTGPRKFLADIREQIAAAALSPPRVLIGMNQWSLAKLRQYLIEQKIVADVSLPWLRVLLREAGVRWRRTKTWKESTDPEFWPKYRKIRRLYAKRPAGGRRLSIDEFGPLNLQPRHGGCWARGGIAEIRVGSFGFSDSRGATRGHLALPDLAERPPGNFPDDLEKLPPATSADQTPGATCRMKPYNHANAHERNNPLRGLFLSYWPNGHFFQNAKLLN